jgi:hypothetical protein
MCRICSTKLVSTEYTGGPAAAAGIGFARFQAHYQMAAESGLGFGKLFMIDMAAPIDGTSKYMSTAFPVDGQGDLKPPVIGPTILITTDNVPDAPDKVGSTNPVLTVTGPGVTTPIVSTIDSIGDQDFYKVTLTAGVTYELGLYSYNGGPNAAGLTDPYMELYAADGTTLVVSADGGAHTVYNELNSGFDVLLTFTPTETATYYVNARAYSNSPATPTGDSVGDYQLFAREQDPNDPNLYTPYYEPDDPLYSLDWGTQVDKVNTTVRNPDGNEGTRDTGNAQGTPTFGNQFRYDPDGNGPQTVQTFDMNGLAAAQGKDITGKNVITIYFAREGDVFASNDPTQPGLPPATITAVAIKDYEFTAVFTALAEFEKVADVVYLEVSNREDADFIYTSYTGTPGRGTPSLLGSMSPPGESDEGLAQFNSNDHRWNARDLAQGGFSFVTLIHEFGHGHGMAHPHDNGGRSGIMRGVEEEGAAFDYTTGAFNLNQGVFTMMSYEDGWQTSPYGNARTDVGYGYLGGLMAFDIAVIQDKYGVNEEYATGDDVYTLKDVNAAGTFYSSIWDGGGNDEIVYGGARNATIDLRPATLKYEEGGGGRVSFAHGIFGGFTIANGVTIENATSGSGNDTLRGNSAANRLDGGAGDDTIWLTEGGIDTALGGAGKDAFVVGKEMTSADVIDGGSEVDQIGLQGDYTGARALTLTNVTNVEQIALLSGTNTRFEDSAGNLYSYDITTVDSNVAAGQQMQIDGVALRAGENFTFNGSAETDGSFLVWAGKGTDNLTGGAGNDGFLFRGNGNWSSADRVDGGAGSDQLGIRGNYGGANAIVFGATQITGIETLALMSGTDTRFGAPIGDASYDVTMNDGNVAAGTRMNVDATFLRTGETLIFNGSAESDGSFRIFGGQASDTITGSQNGDSIRGGKGADRLTGGGGDDVFVYRNAGESTGAGFDTLVDFNLGDKIDLPTSVSGFAGSVSQGALNSASFNADLSAALDGVLEANQAVLFTASEGEFAGRRFLVVDGDGDGAYTEGADYVFELGSSAIIDTSSAAFFV